MNIREIIEQRMPVGRLIRSYEAVSFSPEKRGRDEQAETIAWLEERLPKLPDPERALERYLKLWGAYVGARSRTMSPMITGPAKFPTERNRKRVDVEFRRMGDLVEFQRLINGQIAKIERGIDENAPIRSDDPDAAAQIRAKIAKVEAEWAQRKLWNAQYRKGGIGAIEGIGEKLRATIEQTMVVCPWLKAPFSLTSYGPEVKRLKGRLIELERKSEMPDVDRELAPGVQLLIRPEENRVRLVFDGKPSPEVRERLKRNGFRWAPTEGAWQRYYSEQAIYAAKNAVKDLLAA